MTCLIQFKQNFAGMTSVRVAVRLRPFLHQHTEESTSCVRLYTENPKEQIVELTNNSKQPKELLRYKYVIL